MGTVYYRWPREGYTVHVSIEYSWSPIRAATYIDPPEGGVIVDSIAAVLIVWDEDEFRKATVNELATAELDFPSDLAWRLCQDDHQDRKESAMETHWEHRSRTERLMK